MKNILFVHQSASLYGSDKVLLALVGGLNRGLYYPIVLLPEYGPLKQGLERIGIEVHAVPLCRVGRASLSWRGLLRLPFDLFGSLRRMDGLLAGRQIDIVHSNTLAVLSGALWARKHRIPHVWHVHEIIERPPAARKAFAWLLDNFAERVVCVSAAVKDNLLQDRASLGPAIRVVSNGLERGSPPDAAAALRYRRELCIGDNEVLVVLTGRVNRLKGHALLVEAAELLLARAPLKVRFLMVGDAPPGQEAHLDALRARIAMSPVRDRIMLHPYEADIWKVWDACDIAVVPSTEPEAFGMVALEAMAAGKPVVAAAHGGLREVVADGQTGLLFAPGNVGALANALSQLIADPVLSKAMGERGLKRCGECFSMRRFEDGIADIYGGIKERSRSL